MSAEIPGENTEQGRLNDYKMKLELALESGNAIIYCLDFKKDGYIYLSEAGSHISGLGIDELRSMTVAESRADFHPEDLERIDRQIEQSISRGDKEKDEFVFEYRRKIHDGSYSWFRDYCTIYFDRDGGIDKVAGTAYDISREKALQEELELNRRRFDEVLKNAGQVLYCIDYSHDGFTYISESVQRLTGYTVEEYKRKSIEDIRAEIHPDDLQLMQKEIFTAGGSHKNGNCNFVFENRRLDKFGRYKWYSDWQTVYYDSEGQVYRIVGSVYDITEKKHAQFELEDSKRLLEQRVEERTAALAESEKKYRLLAETTSEMISMADENGKFNYISPAWERFTGFTIEEIFENGPYNLVHPDHRAMIDGMMADILKDKSKKSIQWKCLCKDGQYKWVETDANVVANEDGSGTIYISSTRDISYRKQQEQILAAQRDLGFALSSATDIDQVVQTVLDSISGIEGVIGSSFFVRRGNKFIHADYRNLADDFVEGFDEIDIENELFKWLLKDGKRFGDFSELVEEGFWEKPPEGHFKAYGVVPLTYNDETLGLISFVSGSFGQYDERFQIITESIATQVGGVLKRLSVEEALRDSEHTARVLLNSPGSAAFLLENDGTVLTLNAKAKEFMGAGDESLEGKCLFDYFEPEVASKRRQRAEVVVLSGKPLFYEEFSKGRYYEVSIFPIFNSKGQVARVAVYLDDVTEQKKGRQQLEQFHKRMRHAEQLAASGTLSATVAHELNQPVTAMKLFLQQMQRSLQKGQIDAAKGLELTGDCLDELEKASRIINRFRDFARKSSPSRQVEVDLCGTALRVAEMLRQNAREKSARIEVKRCEKPVTITGDVEDFEQMLFVLVQNSIQAAGGNKNCTITLAIEDDGKNICISVGDDCGGIAKEDLAKIFEPFYTTKPAGRGTGLGLCVLERLVRKYSGAISVDSEYGKGTVFYLNFKIK